jgi:ABC-type uncharacterized transport system permease subunit
MVLIVTPALDGLKREWREACDCLGGSVWQYWRYVALPVLWPSTLGHSLRVDWQFAEHRADPAFRADSRRRDA